MPPLTRRRLGETTRKLGVMLALGLLSGCATTGPNHVYLTTAASPAVHDLGPPPAEVGGAVPSPEPALGLAYDFNTDHLFVRLAQVIRVIERPSGKILRELPLPVELQTSSSADLAIRSRDRHLFVVYPGGRAVAELTVLGEFVRRIELAEPAGPVGGLAYDQRSNRLLILSATHDGTRIGAFNPAGNVIYWMTLASAVRPVSLGYDSNARHFFVPLADDRTLGEFDQDGQLVARHPVDGVITAVDAGSRSFVRVF